MNNDEKMYLLKKCNDLFCSALNYNSVIAFEKANMLKEIIEKLIDCQDTKYHSMYMSIVRLYNVARSRNYPILIKR